MAKCNVCKKYVSNDIQYHFNKFHPEFIIDSGNYTNKNVLINEKSMRETIVVDGTNVAHSTTPPSIFPLKSIRSQIINEHKIPIIIISQALKHQIDNKNELLRLINIGWVTEADNDRDDDQEVIETAISTNSKIVSNDNFREYRELYQDKFDFSKLIKYRVTNGKIKLSVQ